MSLTHLASNNNAGHNDPTSLLSNGWPAAWIADDPDAATGPEAVLEAAKQYVAAGLSVIPIEPFEGDKSPDPRRLRSWKLFQFRLPRADELQAWYERGGPMALAVIAGRVSGGGKGLSLEIVDFDKFELFSIWRERVEQRAPGLVDRLVRIRSPRPGMHVYFRSPVAAESQKLAWGYERDRDGIPLVDEHGRPKKKGLVETKAEAGYCVVCPSPRRCHMSNRRYVLVEGSPPLTEVPVITPEDRAILIEEAIKFNECSEVEPRRVGFVVPKQSENDGNRPGDHFAREVSWAEILEPCGWVLVRQQGEEEFWQRPGKDGGGISATTNYQGTALLYVFSTNGFPFDNGRGYNKFHAYALLNYGGDFKKAAKALQEEGYGPKALPAGRRAVSGGVQSINLNGTKS